MIAVAAFAVIGLGVVAADRAAERFGLFALSPEPAAESAPAAAPAVVQVAAAPVQAPPETAPPPAAAPATTTQVSTIAEPAPPPPAAPEPEAAEGPTVADDGPGAAPAAPALDADAEYADRLRDYDRALAAYEEREHTAGYRWAQRNNVRAARACEVAGERTPAFAEGCREYLRFAQG